MSDDQRAERRRKILEAGGSRLAKINALASGKEAEKIKVNEEGEIRNDKEIVSGKNEIVSNKETFHMEEDHKEIHKDKSRKEESSHIKDPVSFETFSDKSEQTNVAKPSMSPLIICRTALVVSLVLLCLVYNLSTNLLVQIFVAFQAIMFLSFPDSKWQLLVEDVAILCFLQVFFNSILIQ